MGYYERALSRASNEGNTEVLPSLNNSVAETYKDLEEYDSALYFFEKQLVNVYYFLLFLFIYFSQGDGRGKSQGTGGNIQ